MLLCVSLYQSALHHVTAVYSAVDYSAAGIFSVHVMFSTASVHDVSEASEANRDSLAVLHLHASLVRVRRQVESTDESDDHDDGAEWRNHSSVMRHSRDMTDEACPWTPYHGLRGLKKRPRFLDCVQVAFWAWRRKTGAGTARGKTDTPHFFVDYTQSVHRSPWGNVPHSINQHSKLYSFELDRVLDPEDPCRRQASLHPRVISIRGYRFGSPPPTHTSLLRLSEDLDMCVRRYGA
jgi:hypothetical protein